MWVGVGGAATAANQMRSNINNRGGKKGGLVIQRHNEIRDCIGDIASQVWTHVIKEPVVREADVNNADGGLRLDLGIRGVWQPQVEALFDVKVVDTNAPSHRTRSPDTTWYGRGSGGMTYRYNAVCTVRYNAVCTVRYKM